MTKKLALAAVLGVVVLTGAGCFGRGEQVRNRVQDKKEEKKDQAINTAISAFDEIEITSPLENEVVESPLVITGRARGVWYFEATFPIELYDANDQLIASKVAQAQSDWQTNDWVDFRATLEFETPDTATGTLVLKKDNPSGLTEHDKKVEIPVRFEE